MLWIWKLLEAVVSIESALLFLYRDPGKPYTAVLEILYLKYFQFTQSFQHERTEGLKYDDNNDRSLNKFMLKMVYCFKALFAFAMDKIWCIW